MRHGYYNISRRMAAVDIVAIVNPLSGAGASAGTAASRLDLLTRQFADRGLAGAVHLTERPHHAGELARAAVAAGASKVIAWGGDGTINEVGTALAGTSVTLAVVPAGSGNGFANELGIPRPPIDAIRTALGEHARSIDAGEIDGRLFFNIAGIGFDASVAEQFNARGKGRRGLAPYVVLGLRASFRYRAARYRITLDDETFDTRALVVAFANGREYGNRIRLCPTARMDDGRLEAVIVPDCSPLARLWLGRHLALGTADRAPGLITRSIVAATIESDAPMTYHADGEIGRTDRAIAVRIRPAALKVMVPAPSDSP